MDLQSMQYKMELEYTKFKVGEKHPPATSGRVDEKNGKGPQSAQHILQTCPNLAFSDILSGPSPQSFQKSYMAL
ncbi:hypothetical protein PoB_003986900 [Plakobranchus ocellatus]|uniref:Uncharacterized protein n=1 Tax=Plakobranchus ocellatus TaxID=259542 RepID=A0AAV4B4R1_9GAST|nr:hypothetical protein PoB_003986900 [Plakobranchus ocellatus]